MVCDELRPLSWQR